jgi:hypothetical protein
MVLTAEDKCLPFPHGKYRLYSLERTSQLYSCGIINTVYRSPSVNGFNYGYCSVKLCDVFVAPGEFVCYVRAIRLSYTEITLSCLHKQVPAYSEMYQSS